MAAKPYSIEVPKAASARIEHRLHSPACGLLGRRGVELRGDTLVVSGRPQTACVLASLQFGCGAFSKGRTRLEYFLELSDTFPFVFSPVVAHWPEETKMKTSNSVELLLSGTKKIRRVLIDHSDGLVWGYTSVMPLSKASTRQYLSNKISQYELGAQDFAENAEDLGLLYIQAVVMLPAVLRKYGVNLSNKALSVPDWHKNVERHVALVLAKRHVPLKEVEWGFEVYSAEMIKVRKWFREFIKKDSISKDGQARIVVSSHAENIKRSARDGVRRKDLKSIGRRLLAEYESTANLYRDVAKLEPKCDCGYSVKAKWIPECPECGRRLYPV